MLLQSTSNSIRRTAVFVAVTVAVATAPLAAEPLQLDADLAVEIALQRNLGIRTQELARMIEERNYSDRWNVFVPQISAQATLARPNVEPTDPFAELFEEAPGIAPLLGDDEPEDPPRWNLRTSIDISFTFTRAMIYNMRSREQALEAATMELREARRETERDIRLAFYELLLQQEQIALAERRLEEAEQRYAEVQEDYDAGFIDEFVLLSTQVALENQRPALRRRQQGYSMAIREFALTIGVPPDEELLLEGDIGIEPAPLREESELLRFAGRNADVAAARRAIAQLRTAGELTRSELYPTLTLGFNVDPTLDGDPFSDDLFDLDLWSQQSGSFNVTVRVPIDPLLPRSSTRTQIYEREQEIEQARLRVRQVEDGVESQLLALVETLEITTETLNSLELNVELAERAYELATEGYEAGLRTISEVRDAEIDLLDARLELLSEQFNYREALVELGHLLDTPIDEIQENDE